MITRLQTRVVSLLGSGPPLIVVGLVALLVVAVFSTLPAVTALSILTLGATNATLDRFRNSPGIAATALLHTAVYTTLYALFIGARLHAAASTPSNASGRLTALDLAVSVLLMAIALRRIIATLRQRFEPQR